MGGLLRQGGAGGGGAHGPFGRPWAGGEMGLRSGEPGAPLHLHPCARGDPGGGLGGKRVTVFFQCYPVTLRNSYVTPPHLLERQNAPPSNVMQARPQESVELPEPVAHDSNNVNGILDLRAFPAFTHSAGPRGGGVGPHGNRGKSWNSWNSWNTGNPWMLRYLLHRAREIMVFAPQGPGNHSICPAGPEN